VRFEEIGQLLFRFGFAKRQSGSHATYTLKPHLSTVPFRKPYILPIYVRSILEIIAALEADSDAA
jgi:predicted RNA binding protein YcfA (HicA-like mRNA interferase family)